MLPFLMFLVGTVNYKDNITCLIVKNISLQVAHDDLLTGKIQPGGQLFIKNLIFVINKYLCYQ